ncbi:MAG: hypothetical protein NZ839_03925, partial [Endomicrobia bacterium]|nr:hypothetical protein [Endomicrobiia bacterium]
MDKIEATAKTIHCISNERTKKLKIILISAPIEKQLNKNIPGVKTSIIKKIIATISHDNQFMLIQLLLKNLFW